MTDSPHRDTSPLPPNEELYRIAEWGGGYFAIGEGGSVQVRPQQSPKSAIDLLEVVEGLEARGITPPVLIRFPDLLHHRLREIHGAFKATILEHKYQGGHVGIYPIKVNQQRHVVESIYTSGSQLGFGLEVGSKPELLAVLGLAKSGDDRLIICNGFKDDEYIKSAILARKLGRNVVPVVEDVSELRLILKHAARYGVDPRFGLRVKLAAMGSGRWEGSAGPHSKFGLTIPQLVTAVNDLTKRGMAHCLQLLHCHMGSQIHDIKKIKEGINELAHVYVGLKQLGATLGYLDVGGGLGVDYDGSRSNVESSINYSLDEYAADIVYRVMNVCDHAGIEHPNIVTECGRAMTAHHSVLVFNVLGATTRENTETFSETLESELGPDAPQPIRDLLEAHRSVSSETLVAGYHDALQARDETLHLFNLGYLDISLRGMAERLFWATCTRIRNLSRDLESVPDELRDLEEDLRDIYFCNFSLFQSLPDSWALRQVFPIMPIQRLNEAPTRLGILADITCDSDGKVDLFPQHRDKKRTLELHDLKEGEPYYLGVFLVGAYQETLGDLHNLFGDTHVVHVAFQDSSEQPSWKIQDVIDGDTVREVLGYFQYSPDLLLKRIREDCEQAVSNKAMRVDESRSLHNFYRHALNGYTYLEPEEE